MQQTYSSVKRKQAEKWMSYCCWAGKNFPTQTTSFTHQWELIGYKRPQTKSIGKQRSKEIEFHKSKACSVWWCMWVQGQELQSSLSNQYTCYITFFKMLLSNPPILTLKQNTRSNQTLKTSTFSHGGSKNYRMGAIRGIREMFHLSGKLRWRHVDLNWKYFK